MKKYLVKLIQKSFSISAKLNTSLFLLIANVVYFIFNRSVKIRFDKTNKAFYAYDKSLQTKHYFLIPSRATGFIRGLEKRFIGMAKNYLIDDFKFSDGDVVLDVGANIGDIKGFLNLQNKDIKYYGFEPSGKEYDVLKLNCKDSTIINKGCWHEDGIQTFYISSEGADSSFEEPASRVESKVEMEVMRLDGFLDEEIKLLKIDGEGCELEILQGCLGILPKIQYISVDAGYERGILELCTFAEVSNYLYKNGFYLEGFRSKSQRVLGLFKNAQ